MSEEKKFLPYGRQSVREEDIRAVTEVLRGDFLTTGPLVERFEQAVAEKVGIAHAVAVSSGTAALHTAVASLGLEQGDEVILPTLTFAATASAVVHCGLTPVFADVDPDTLLLTPDRMLEKITPRTRAVIGVDYAGQPCDYDAMREAVAATGANIHVIADASHSLGATDHGRPVGSLAELSSFSFHAVKQITTGEGGMITTDSDELALRMRRFRNHGFSKSGAANQSSASWEYQLPEPGFNYRLSDILCALGLSQLDRLDDVVAHRSRIASLYDQMLATHETIRPLAVRMDIEHGRHLYVVRLPADRRADIFAQMRAAGIGVQVHYRPVHLFEYYQSRFGTSEGDCPAAESTYKEILSLPIHPEMAEADGERTVEMLTVAIG